MCDFGHSRTPRFSFARERLAFGFRRFPSAFRRLSFALRRQMLVLWRLSFGIRRRTFGFTRLSFAVQRNPFARMRFCTRNLARFPSKRSIEWELPGILGRTPAFCSHFNDIRSRSCRRYSRLCDLPFVFVRGMHLHA